MICDEDRIGPLLCTVKMYGLMALNLSYGILGGETWALTGMTSCWLREREGEREEAIQKKID